MKVLEMSIIFLLEFHGENINLAPDYTSRFVNRSREKANKTKTSTCNCNQFINMNLHIMNQYHRELEPCSELRPGLKHRKLELILKLKIKHNDWLLLEPFFVFQQQQNVG